MIDSTISSQEDFDNFAALLHEAEMEIFWQKAQFALAAELAEQKSRAAYWWHCASGTVSALARRAREIPEEHRYCDIPKNLPDAAIACADEHRNSPKPWRRLAWRWLRQAREHKLSARQLKDRADVGRGKRVSQIPYLPNVDCNLIGPFALTPDTLGVTLEFVDYEPSGDPPKRVKVRAVEVLTEKGEP